MGNTEIQGYNSRQPEGDREVCDLLQRLIDEGLPLAESKIWHGHPVWFLEGNPTVGYSKEKSGIRLRFWSGADFWEEALRPGTGKFKDASILYRTVSEISDEDLARWLRKSIEIRWDYKNLMKRKGRLERWV